MSKKLSKNEIIELFKSSKIQKDWSFEGFKPSETGKWTHSYHRYPAKFIPQLVEKLIDEYIPNSVAHINDPFMGSGTTIATAISRGFMASGTDINAIAYLMAKVKSTPIEPNYLESKINLLFSRLGFSDELQIFASKVIEPLVHKNHIEKINYWFNEDNKIKLGLILKAIYHEEDEIIRDFFLVAFSHILKKCSIWLQGSTKPTRDLKKTPSKPFIELKRHLNKMKEGNYNFYKVVPEKTKMDINSYLKIELGDARKQPLPDDCVDLVISSSPYVTSYEYADLHQLSTIWLDYTDDLKEYRSKFIGTAYKNYNHIELKSEIAKSIVSQMEKKSKKVAKEIETFFYDMQQVFNESFRILKPNGRCCYVIGNTKLRKIDILNAEAFAESIQYAGFTIEKIIVREIPLKILPQKRDEKTGRFASNENANSQAYPIEYIVIGKKE
ncbi:MAG TPA: DNA methyltransferase [Syntrophorhabdaceae bacterium]|jgi:DNA modification methylase|nr:hypothetical protein [Syntrophorhabdaceae bacterium]HNY45094.1 DNA methyltransferase [Bacteroidales bacterium]MBV6505532.1 hypothetical protein [Syntrophorhabdaceae bacterium]HNQ62902.1 DNA methyltransferase [Syntrophorhabdaceae bacterium]HOB68627.1 DNA methyltransferase [Syntrophorhabdaceae bacterium]